MKKRAVKLTYRPAFGDTPYVVTGTVNTREVKLGDALSVAGLDLLISQGCEVRITA